MKRAVTLLRSITTLLALFAFAFCARATLADIVVQDTSAGDVTYWMMNGAAKRDAGTIYHNVSPEWKIVGIADLDQDGVPDLIWQNTNTGDVAYWLMFGTSLSSSGYIYHNLPLEWKVVGAADLDLDGYPDLILQNTKTGDVVYWLLNGTKISSSGYIAYGVPTEWKIEATADLDQDGYADLIWRDTKTGTVAYWLMNSTSLSSGGYMYYGVGPDWKIVGTPSLNGDGQTSLLWQNTKTGTVAYWLLNGTSFLDSGYIAKGLPSTQNIVGTADWTQADLSVGNPATPFRRPDLNGNTVHFPGDYHGKLVMLDFWATWCGPCLSEIPGLVTVYNKYHSRGFNVLGVSLDYAADTDANALKSFLTAHNMLWPQIYDGLDWSAQIAVLYNVQSIPQPFLINGNTGQIVAWGDSLRGDALDGTIKNALQNMGL